MVGNRRVAWYVYILLALLIGCVADKGPTTDGGPTPKPAAVRNAPESQTPPASKPAEPAVSSPATAPTQKPDAPQKPAAKAPTDSPPVAQPTPPAREEQAKAEPARPVERRDIPGDNRARTPDLRADGIHDPKSPGLASMQNPSQSLSALPIGRWGEIDWMQALTRKSIRPRANLKTEGNMEVLDLDIIMTNTKSMPHVRFPHNSHTQWLACSNCHPQIFVAKKGGNTMPMNDILKGQYCGTCHGKVSFSVYICQRCHSVVHEGSPDKWW